MTGIMRGRGREPLCPFCGMLFEMPHDIKTEFGNVFSGGKCECGAVYIYDRSGHNRGEAYVDGLVYACNGDWDRAWQLIPDVDYRIESLNYDAGSHRIMQGAGRGGRSTENLLFIKLIKSN